MKMVKLAGFLLLTAVFFTACKKDRDAPRYAVEGLWSGNIGTGDQPPANYFALYLKNEGTLEYRTINGKTTARGYFDISGTDMKGQYVFDSDGSLVTFTAVMDAVNNKLTGKWEDDKGFKGTWIIVKN